MYHVIKDAEHHPDDYELREVLPSFTEDECFDFLSNPRQTQKTIALYLKKIRDERRSPKKEVPQEECKPKRSPLEPGSEDLERAVERNKGFWVDRPEWVAPFTYKLRENYWTDVKKQAIKDQGIFYRPKSLELDHLIKMAKAGLLYPEEEFSESEEEIQPEETTCTALRKVRYKICDPCKEKPKEKKHSKVGEEEKCKSLFEKIPTGCQCDYYGEHNRPPKVWDFPYEDEADMLRQHEMNKVARPYKHELLNNYYKENPPVKFMAHEPGMKKTFPIYQISNL